MNKGDDSFSGWRRVSLRTKLQVGILGFALLFLATSAVTVLVTAKFYFHQKSVRDLRMLGSVLAENSGAALVFNDQASAEKVLQSFRQNPAVTGAALFRQGSDQVFAEYPYPGAAGKQGMVAAAPGVTFAGEHYVTLVPVMVNGQEEGYLVFQSNLDEWRQLKADLLDLFFILLVGTVLLTLVASSWLKAQITRPIESLAEWATQVSRHKDFYARAEKRNDDEIGHLADSLNTMLEELARQETIMRLNAELEKEIQERKLIEKDLIDTRNRAEEANKAKSRFLANMSHELRTPLNAIIGYSEMLQEMIAEENISRDELSSDIDKVRGAGKHLLNLINDILDISKIEAGRMQLSIEAFNVDQLVGEVADTLRPLAVNRNNQLLVKSPEPIGYIQSDQVKVRQVLFNLLSNAVKFTHEGVVELEYRIQVEGDQRWIVYSVRDTGIGISETAIRELFQPFSQADPSTTRKYGGTGLGLAISRSYISMLGGTVTVNSEEGKGSEFVVRLPLMPASHLTRDAEDSNSVETHSGVEGELIELVGKLPRETRLLLIDDDPYVHEILIHCLKKNGFFVQSALSGEEGLQLAAIERPDVIVLDVFMPGMDGWQVLTELKSKPDTVSIPVLLYTIVSDEARGYALGATDYLIKPITNDRLLDVLSRYRKNSSSTKVLSIDDDPHSQALIRAYLNGPEWQVISAANGREGLVQLERNPDIAIILLDLIMPEMNGFDFLEACRPREGFGTIPIVVISARDLTSDERAALLQDTKAVMRKGMYDKNTLISQIRHVLNGVSRQQPTGG